MSCRVISPASTAPPLSQPERAGQGVHCLGGCCRPTRQLQGGQDEKSRVKEVVVATGPALVWMVRTMSKVHGLGGGGGPGTRHGGGGTAAEKEWVSPASTVAPAKGEPLI